MAEDLRLHIERILLLQETHSEAEEEYLVELREQLVDFQIAQELPVAVSAEMVNKLFHRTTAVASEKSTSPGFVQGVLEVARAEHAKGVAGIIYKRFPVYREVENLRRVPLEMQKRRKPKLTIYLDPDIFSPQKVRLDFRAFTAEHISSEPLSGHHPLAQVAEIEFLQSDEKGPIIARVGYEVDSRTKDRIQPHWDHQKLVWHEMTAPQAKMLDRMLPLI